MLVEPALLLRTELHNLMNSGTQKALSEAMRCDFSTKVSNTVPENSEIFQLN